MSTTTTHNGGGASAAQPVVVELSVDVDEFRMTWRLTLQSPESPSEVDRGAATLNVSERRRATIDLLAALLRRNEDRLLPDALADDLHRKLRVVLGHELFDLLFSDLKVRKALATQLRELRNRNVDLFRLRLTFEGESGPWFATLPWEYACTPEGESDLFDPAGFLADASALVLSRSPPLGTDLVRETPPVTVLLVVASPDDFAVEAAFPWIQSKDVLAALQVLEAEGLITLHTLLDVLPEGEDGEEPKRPGFSEVTELQLRQRIEEVDPVILHYIGHGRSWAHKAELALETDSGKVDWRDGEEFVEIVSGGRRLQLAFFQAYESDLPDPYASFSGVARRLAGELPAVVAMQCQADAVGATSFAVQFYDALLRQGLPIDHAVEQGRLAALGNAGADDAARGLPVVYLGGPGSLVEPALKRITPGLEAIDRNDVAICSRCDVELPAGGEVCARCGLRAFCSKCATRFPEPERTRFCPTCGTKVKERPFADDAIEQRGPPPPDDTSHQVLNALRELQGRDPYA